MSAQFNQLARPLIAATLLLLAGATAAPAQQNTAVGLWQSTSFQDDLLGMPQLGAQQICVKPDGTWFGPLFAGWQGRWFQKVVNPPGFGDRVRLIGNYSGGAGNDSAELDFVSADMMAGTWTEWRDNLASLYWLRINLTRVSAQCGVIAGAQKADPNANPMAMKGKVPAKR